MIPLEKLNKVKELSVWIHKKLSFKEHIHINL